MLYDALPPHVTLVIVVDPNGKDYRKPNFAGEVSPFFLLCIDEGSFCSMLNHERGTATVTCEALRATNGQVLREQFEHLQVGGCAISVGIHPRIARQRPHLCRVFCCAGPPPGHRSRRRIR